MMAQTSKDSKMINRRDLGKGLGLLAASTVAGCAMAGADSTARAVAPSAPSGPWTATHQLRRAGGVLHYATIGERNPARPPVVLLHKLGGWMADWRHVAPALAQGRQVIAFDLPGHGESRWDGPAPYIFTLGELAAILVSALDEMGIDRIDLFGTSIGGCIAVILAALWPERVNSIAVISSALGGRRTLAQIRQIVDEKQVNLFDAKGDPLPTTTDQLRQIFGIVHADEINVESNAARLVAGRWIQPCERGVAITDIAGAVPRVMAPTLLVYGANDKAYLKFRPSIEPMLHKGRSALIAHSGAFVMQDNPTETARVLRDFLHETTTA